MKLKVGVLSFVAWPFVGPAENSGSSGAVMSTWNTPASERRPFPALSTASIRQLYVVPFVRFGTLA